MAITIKKLFDATLLTAAAATYYTSDDVVGTKTIIKKLVITNPTAGPVLCGVWLVKKADASGSKNTIFAQTLVSGETKDIYAAENMVMEQGDFIQAIGLNCNMQGSGILITA